MKIIFWQNVLSMHQEALLVNLVKSIDVWLIYEEELSKDRIDMGWSIPNFNKVKLLNINNLIDTEKLFKSLNEDYHIFSGINVYKNITKYFNIFYKLNPERIICFLEKPGGISIGIKSYIRKLKYMIYSYRYENLKFILTPGGADYLINVGFNKDKIIPFNYYGPLVENQQKQINNGIVELIYVGNISKLKNVKLIINSLILLKYEKWHMNIIGSGHEMKSLMKIVDDSCISKQITFLGKKNNDEVQKILLKSDYLLLPSLYDGWGYVVNEAISKGCSVICSDTCGASSAVENCVGSYVFPSNNLESLVRILKKVINKGSLNDIKRMRTIDFFNDNLSGKCGAEKLLNLLDYTKKECI